MTFVKYQNLNFYIKFSIDLICDIVIKMWVFFDEKAVEGKILSTILVCQAMKTSVSSVAQLQLSPCDPMDCGMPSFPLHHKLPKLAQTHIHQVSDAIQPPHPLSSPSPPTFNLSQHQGLFK